MRIRQVVSFERNIAALREELAHTDERIRKLEMHMAVARRQAGGGTADETVRRLERNLANLRKRRGMILDEIG